MLVFEPHIFTSRFISKSLFVKLNIILNIVDNKQSNLYLKYNIILLYYG